MSKVVNLITIEATGHNNGELRTECHEQYAILSMEGGAGFICDMIVDDYDALYRKLALNLQILADYMAQTGWEVPTISGLEKEAA